MFCLHSYPLPGKGAKKKPDKAAEEPAASAKHVAAAQAALKLEIAAKAKALAAAEAKKASQVAIADAKMAKALADVKGGMKQICLMV